nr:uncharacterized protein LOC107441530 [Parasteatoda tepidariorum]
MKIKDTAWIIIVLSGVFLAAADDDKDEKTKKIEPRYDDDHDNHRHHDDDDDGVPDYCPKDNGMFPNDNDCSTFYNCIDGQAILQSCAPGLLFDKEKKMCNFPNQAKCSNMCQGPNGMFPSPHRCDEYVLCNNNKPKVVRCKKGLYFDPNLQVCNYKGQVLCNLPKRKKKDKSGNYKDDDHKKPTVIIKYIESSKSRGTDNDDDEMKALAAASVKSVCPKARGLFAHAENCKSFYQCYDGEVKLKSCPPGLLFDDFKHSCAYEKDVDCGSRLVFHK